MTDRIEKTIDLNAPIERVWCALTDHREFGSWFRVDLDSPFVVGEITSGRVTFPGYEGCPWQVEVQEMREPTFFSFTWHPHAVDRDIDYEKEQPTLVEFRLEAVGDGTRLTVVESGFDAVPEARRWTAIRENDKGWAIQMENIRSHVEA